MLSNASLSHPVAYQTESLGYHTVESLLDDVSKQMASSNLARRHSKGSGGQQQRTSGMMRVVKPNSTSNSPRNSTTLSRRRTVMGDGPYKRRPTVVDQSHPSGNAYGELPSSIQARPVSWHPTTYMAAPEFTPFDYSIPRVEVNDGMGAYGLPLTPATYSGYASPASNFSPLSQPFLGYDQPYPYTEESTFFPPYSAYQPSTLSQQTGVQDFSQNPTDSSMLAHGNWNILANNGFHNNFDSTTTPPTPENFLTVHPLQPNFPADESIPYHDLENLEDSGEELIGMGLYDTPEKSSVGEPVLDNYRALMMHQLMGVGYHKAESTGKGLKLEEAWVPTASDEDEDGPADEDEDDDADAENSPAAEEPADTTSQVADMSNSVAAYDSQVAAAPYEQLVPVAAPLELYASQYYPQNAWF